MHPAIWWLDGFGSSSLHRRTIINFGFGGDFMPFIRGSRFGLFDSYRLRTGAKLAFRA